MSNDHRFLLAEAARLYERHEAGRLDTFNVFSVLRSESDEVNLHSRFLSALLDWKSARDEIENLDDFLRSVADVQNFNEDGILVERERDNIDILVTNKSQQAVVIENKIWAGDQPKQLQRYYDTLKHQGFREIHLRYLTPDGHDPSEDSSGGHKYANLAYRDDQFQNWLRRCQQRAYDEPPLRESIAQYLRLVQRLTGTDYSEAYMDSLVQLCLRDNNLVLVHDLKEAMDKARIRLLCTLWKEIEEELKRNIRDLPKKHEISDTSEQKIQHFVTGQRNLYHGLYYQFGEHAKLGIEVEGSNGWMFFGVRCGREENEIEHNELRTRTKDMGGGSNDWWPWSKYPRTDLNLRDPQPEHLKLLANDNDRAEYVTDLVNEIKPVWEEIRELASTD